MVIGIYVLRGALELVQTEHAPCPVLSEVVGKHGFLGAAT